MEASRVFLRELVTSIDELQLSTREDLDQVVLVGGSSRLLAPGVVIAKCTGQEPRDVEDVDHCVAVGAALFHKYLLHEVPMEGEGGSRRVSVIDCTSKSLGIQTRSPEGVMGWTEMVVAYDRLPTHWEWQPYSTPDNTGNLMISVRQRSRGAAWHLMPLRQRPAKVLQKDQWQHECQAQLCGWMYVTDATWNKSALRQGRAPRICACREAPSPEGQGGREGAPRRRPDRARHADR